MADEIVITLQGKKDLEQKLEVLKNEMSEIITKIKEARELGDISENAEYDAAKNEQAQVDAKITEIEQTLRLARIIDDAKINKNVVSLGCKVKILDKEMKEKSEFAIVGTTEADPKAKKMSNVSPIGAALLGRKKGEVVKVQAPGGVIEIEILEIN